MTRKTTRIEPTLSGGDHQVDEQIREHSHAIPSHHHARKSQTDSNASSSPEQLLQKLVETLNAIKTFFLEKVLINRQVNIMAGTVIGLALIVSFVISLFSDEPEVLVSEKQNIKHATDVDLTSRSHKITLPDNFSLLATDYNGIVINWQAETTEQQKLWDIKTTEGDDSCSVLQFNNGEQYRTLEVIVENGQQYFANFSPLDSHKVIKAVALRGNFSLCGYKFSLKGSQAVLGKHHYYSEMLSF